MRRTAMRPERPALGRSIAAALDDSATLSGLLAGHTRSRTCFAAARSGMPAALVSQVRPGPIDEQQVWTVFTSTNGAAAKLRQCLPRMLEAVRVKDAQIAEIRVKVSPPAPDHSPR
jgi:hypothetical protein